MLFVFLALYVALGIGCIVAGVRRHSRTAMVCGIVAVGLALLSLVVWLLYALGASHWSVSVLQLLLSPMPESLLEPESLGDTALGSGVPVFVIATMELIVAIALWAVPVFGIVAAGRAPQSPRAT